MSCSVSFRALLPILLLPIFVCACSSKDPVEPTPRPTNPTWKIVSSPTSNDLYAIWGNGPDNVFAVGDLGVVIHYDGIKWSEMPTPTGARLLGVWGSGPDDVYAVGLNEAVIRYNGVGWTPIPMGDSDDFVDVWGASNADVFIATCTGTVRFFDGTGWRPMTIGNNACSHIWGAKRDFVFATGVGFHFYNGIEWDPELWVGPAMNDISGTSTTDITAVGSGGNVRHFDGSTWSAQTSPTIVTLNGVWSRLSNDVYAVGDEGKIIRFNGTEWTSFPALTTAKLYAVWGSSGTNVWVVGRGGIILHYSKG